MNQLATQDEVHAPAKAIDRFKHSLALAEPTLRQMIPSHIPFDRFKAQLITAVAYNPKLLECSNPSLIRAAAECVSVGLSVLPTMREADIVPVWSSNGTVAQFRPRYMGLMKLARQSGDIAKIYAHEVFERDEFTYEYGLDKKLVHKPAADRGELGKHPSGVWGYCVWQTKDGSQDFEVINQARVDRARSASEGYKAYKAEKIKSTPWVTDTSEMVRKTAVHAASKYFPRSTEADGFLRALHADEDHESEAAPLVADDTPQIAAPRTEAGAAAVSKLEERVAAQAEPTTQNATDWPKEHALLAKEITKQDGLSWDKWLAATAERRAALAAAAPELGAKLQAVVEGKTAAVRL